MSGDKPTKTNDKHALRAQMAAIRDALPAPVRHRAAAEICDVVKTIVAANDCVAGFAATRNEVDLSALYQELLDQGVTVCFPRVVGDGEMIFASIDSLSQLRPGAFGILEPSGSEQDIGSIETFLVPALAFDRSGTRLGFGGGFYDRALQARMNSGTKVPLFVGIGYRCQVLDTILPLQDWDVAVHLIVTEQGVVDPGPRTTGETP